MKPRTYVTRTSREHLNKAEFRTYQAVSRVAERHGFTGTDAELEAWVVEHPEHHAEIRRYIAAEPSQGWAGYSVWYGT